VEVIEISKSVDLNDWKVEVIEISKSVDLNDWKVEVIEHSCKTVLQSFGHADWYLNSN
jgi:hypothetical protein